MKREDAEKYINKETHTGFGTGDFYASVASDLMDEIFDDFESQTCKNCKFIEKESEHSKADKHKCAILMAMSSMESELLIGSGFGCNKFERKGE